MSFLSSHRRHNAAADDIEAAAAVPQNEPVTPAPGNNNTGAAATSSSSGDAGGEGEHVKFGEVQTKRPPKSSDLGEFEALDRFITTFDQERRANLASTSPSSQKRKWWQFWKSDEPAAQATERTSSAAGKPPDSWLETDIRSGLASSLVDERRKRFGWNELASEKESMFAKVLGYFTGPILYVMELAALLAVGLQDWIDFGVILGILALNAFVGFYQEKQAADVVASLKGDIAMRATVVRDGREQQILARELVPGDIVIIQEGQTVPGDAQLICNYNRPHEFEQYRELKNEDKFNDEGSGNDKKEKEKPGDIGGESKDTKGQYDNDEEDDEEEDEEEEKSVHSTRFGDSLLACDQSALTGESLAVDKYMGDTIYYTTGCKHGKAYAIITTSAKYSFVGRTAELVQGAKDQGHFKAVMNSIGTSLLVLVMFWILAAWIGGFYRHLRIAQPHVQNLLHYTLVLLIIGVPVGLPVVTTTTLAVGAAYLAKQKAIVQKLTAIESLAVSILAYFSGYDVDRGRAGCELDDGCGDTGEFSQHRFARPNRQGYYYDSKKISEAREILRQGWKTDKFTPFDPVSKRITSYCRLGNDRYICAKGAPRAILALAEVDQETSKSYNTKAREFAQRGFRSLGVAYKKNDEPWVLLGMLSMFDPPREDTAQTIIEAAHLGVPVKMLTGDAIAIAKETCKMLGLGTKVYNSERLIHSGLTGTVQHDLVQRADGFAEVFPEHKYQVVEMLQQRGSLTAMTGDGVNDAPSLKKADCGIAVEGSSEAAQAAADIVFLAPGLSTIILSIKTARQIFQRMKSYVQYRIALCLHLEIYLTTSMIIINETIRPDLVVFIALFADLATVAVAYDNAHVEPRPVEWQLKKIWVISTILGALLATGTWIIRGTLFLRNGGIVQNFGSVQEILFLEVALTENWLIFVTRGGRTWPSWQLVGAIFGVDILATLFCLFGWLSDSGGGVMNTTPHDQFHNSGNGWTDIVTVVVVWAYSIGVTIFIAIVYIALNGFQWVEDLGRKDRNKKDSYIENIIGHINKLALEHEPDPKTGRDKYYVIEKTTAEEEDL
ncbi:hypothetical protein CIB48_g4774 [Xylaria polymorpha]|nr:hypothetical protein CIB48_g4774 [Xylaria polymorpha]